MKKFLFLIGILTVITSCTQYKPAPIDYNSLSRNITTGMTKSEVIKILGVPQNKSIYGKKETYYYVSKAKSSIAPKLLSRTIFFPLGLMTGRDVIRESLGTSEITLEFDENGKLEKFR